MKLNALKTSVKFAFIGSIVSLTMAPPNALATANKHIAVPPQDIHLQKLAPAKLNGVFSHSTMLPIYSNGGVNKKVNQTIYFDAPQNGPLMLIGPDTQNWKLKVTDPNGENIFNETMNSQQPIAVDNIQIGQQNFKGKQIILQTPAVGQWNVELSPQLNRTAQLSASVSNNQPEAYLLFKGDQNYKVYSYLDNNFTTQHSKINLVAFLIKSNQNNGERQLMQQQKPLQGSINKAYATITTPSKKQLTIVLRDDGLNGDKKAGDGQFSASLPTTEVGTYITQLQIEGSRPDGILFSRTTTDLYPIAANAFSFSQSSAKLEQTDKYNALISVPVKSHNNTQTVFMAAEVWGTNPQGQPQSAAWIGGVVSPSHTQQGTTLSLNFDTRWLARQNLTAPYTLKGLRLQTVDTNVPLTELAQLPVEATKSLQFLPSQTDNKQFSKSITQEMLMGKAPTSARSIQAAATSKLLLVHGYCSGSVWNSGNFTNATEFQDYKKSRSHDDFAKQVISFGAPYSSYGIVAHSQGGAAALHMYSKYWTGLDNATNGRLIQSVGTPYQGTALAGNLAVLGQLFGAGCGTNTDLTYSGSANWLSTIPSWAKSQVDYYTTSFKTRWWAYDYCHLATDLFLSDPEDGTTEKSSGQLSGGVNKGHKTGWCHTTGMRDTAQYKDSSRNSSMNSRAAR